MKFALMLMLVNASPVQVGTFANSSDCLAAAKAAVFVPAQQATAKMGYGFVCVQSER
jgi:hypothetical protein